MRCVCLVVASGVEQRARGGVGGGDLILLYRAKERGERLVSARSPLGRTIPSFAPTHTHTNKKRKKRKKRIGAKNKGRI